MKHKLMCSPVATTIPDTVVPGSTKFQADCGHEVWLAPSGVEVITHHETETICTSCVNPADLLEAILGGQMRVTGAQREEVEPLIGKEDLDAVLGMLRAKNMEDDE